MNVKKLTASDFPGINEAKFNEWKALQIKMNREHVIFCLVAAGIWFVSALLISWRFYNATSLIILGFAIYGFDLIKSKRLRQLGKELKMSDRTWAKKKGRAFTE